MDFSVMVQGKFKKDDLIIKYDPDKKFVLSDSQKRIADHIWTEKKTESDKSGTILYNGSLFNMIKLNNNSLSNTLSITLSACTYKDYVATRTRNIVDASNRPLFADPLAICSAVITTDNKILIGKRSGVDGSLGKYHVVGGFIEETRDDLDGIPSPFDAMKREIYEEVKIDIDIDNITCLGIIYDNIAPHPEMCFYSLSDMSYDKIIKLNPDDREVINWEYIDDDPDQLAEFINLNKTRIAVPGLANLIFYVEMKYGKKCLS